MHRQEVRSHVFRSHVQGTNYGGTASLAYYEMRVILARFLYNFDLELCTRNKNWIQQKF